MISENVEDVYENLIKSTEEVALATLPKKKSRSQLKPSASQRVVDARSRLKSISLACHQTPSRAKKIQLITAKKDLDDAYLDAEADYISGKINDLSRHHISNKHHLAWKTVKDLAGKNSNSSVRIKGGSAKKRLENWSSHFQNLLGSSSRREKSLVHSNLVVKMKLKLVILDIPKPRQIDSCHCRGGTV